MVDSNSELCGCAADILFTTLSTSYQVDQVGGGTCERVSDRKSGWVAGVVGFKVWGAV